MNPLYFSLLLRDPAFHEEMWSADVRVRFTAARSFQEALPAQREHSTEPPLGILVTIDKQEFPYSQMEGGKEVVLDYSRVKCVFSIAVKNDRLQSEIIHALADVMGKWTRTEGLGLSFDVGEKSLDESYEDIYGGIRLASVSYGFILEGDQFRDPQSLYLSQGKYYSYSPLFEGADTSLEAIWSHITGRGNRLAASPLYLTDTSFIYALGGFSLDGGQKELSSVVDISLDVPMTYPYGATGAGDELYVILHLPYVRENIGRVAVRLTGIDTSGDFVQVREELITYAGFHLVALNLYLPFTSGGQVETTGFRSLTLQVVWGQKEIDINTTLPTPSYLWLFHPSINGGALGGVKKNNFVIS